MLLDNHALYDKTKVLWFLDKYHYALSHLSSLEKRKEKKRAWHGGELLLWLIKSLEKWLLSSELYSALPIMKSDNTTSAVVNIESVSW